MVLAGGEGKRLLPLTLDRAKPAVPFGGHYRLIDFALSNLANAGFLRVVVLTQYKSHSLDLHISRTWRLSTLLGNYVTTVPAQMRRGPWWFPVGRRHLPEPEHRGGRTTGLHPGLRGGPYLPNGPEPDAGPAHQSGAAATVAAIGVPAPKRTALGWSSPGAGTAHRRFVEKPPTPWLWPPAGRNSTLPWAITSLMPAP